MEIKKKKLKTKKKKPANVDGYKGIKDSGIKIIIIENNKKRTINL